MQRVGILADHRRAGGQKRLGDYLSTENTVEAVRLSRRPEPISAHRLECEGHKKAVEGGQGGALE